MPLGRRVSLDCAAVCGTQSCAVSTRGKTRRLDMVERSGPLRLPRTASRTTDGNMEETLDNSKLAGLSKKRRNESGGRRDSPKHAHRSSVGCAGIPQVGGAGHAKTALAPESRPPKKSLLRGGATHVAHVAIHGQPLMKYLRPNMVNVPSVPKFPQCYRSKGAVISRGEAEIRRQYTKSTGHHTDPRTGPSALRCGCWRERIPA